MLQEPLYLPSDSELLVSIWRLTNDKQVWYEWHAESFLSIPKRTANTDDLLLQPTRGPPSPMASINGFPASPIMDSADPFGDHFRRKGSFSMSSENEYESVKIGHTSLHNPGGRSSWIGL